MLLDMLKLLRGLEQVYRYTMPCILWQAMKASSLLMKPAYLHLKGHELQIQDWESVRVIYNDEVIAADKGELQDDGRLMVKFPGQRVADILEVGGM